MKSSISVIQFGCGPIGCRMVQSAVERESLSIVGAVDIDPGKVNKDLGTVAGIGRSLGVLIEHSLDQAINPGSTPDVVIHTTGSKLPKVAPQIIDIVRRGINVVSTCEELSYPYRDQRDVAEEIDAAARAGGATVLGTGINPGFLMDTWPLAMTALCTSVREIRCTRIQDARSRRGPFQKKIGAGLTPAEFQARVETGLFGHVGLTESLSMIAAGLGWKIDRIDESIEPVVLNTPLSSGIVTVSPGQGSGIKQIAHGYSGGSVRITLEFQAYLGAPESYDEVVIAGTPDLTIRVIGGTHGDIGTIAMALNAIPRVVAAAPGLVTMKEIPIVHCVP